MSRMVAARADRSLFGAVGGRRRAWFTGVVVAVLVLGAYAPTAALAAAAPSVTNPGTRSSTIGVATSVTVAATGGTKPYTWTATGLPAGLRIASSTGVISGTPTTAGSAAVKVTATDAARMAGTASFTWITATAPAVTNPGTRTAVTGTAVSLTMSRTGGASPFTWTATGLPAGLTINASTGVISGTPTAATSTNSTVTVKDAAGTSGSTAFSWLVTGKVAPANPGAQGHATGVAATLAMTATGGSAPYTWSATGLPAGLTINTSTGVIAGTPVATGTYSTTVTVKDATAQTGSAAFTWSTGPAPVVAAVGAQSGTVGVASSLTLTATGGTGPYTWSAAGLPAGLSINASTGAISGTPTTAGGSAVKVTVTDAKKIPGSLTITWNTTGAVAVTNPGAQFSAVGGAVSLTVTASGGAAPYSWSATGLPAGLSINSSTGTVSGAPSTAGSYSTTITATDSGKRAASAAFAWTVASAPKITDPGAQGGTVGVASSLTLAATGGTTPYTWTASGLPAGLSLNTSTGVVSGTPTTVASATVQVVVTDAKKITGTLAIAWTTAKALTVTNPGTLTSALDVALSVEMVAAGGIAPYTWSATGLPSGLAINASTGVVTGTPTTAGTASVKVTAVDGGKRSGSVTFSWATRVFPVIADPGPQYGTYGTAVTLPMTATGGATPYTWSATGLPAGLTIRSTTGVISGKPTMLGDFSVTVRATDTARTVGSRTFTWSVAEPIVITAPEGKLLLTNVEGDAVRLQFQVTGGKAPFLWSSSELPPGLRLDAKTGLISGVAGTFGWSIDLVATDAVGRAATLTLGWEVKPRLALTARGEFSDVMVAVGRDESPYVIRVIDLTENRVVGTCPGNATPYCMPQIMYKASGVHTFVAQISNPDGTDVQYTSNESTADYTQEWKGLSNNGVTYRLIYPSLGAVDAITIDATAEMAVNSAPQDIYIIAERYEPERTSKIVATCGSGRSCSFTAPKKDFEGYSFYVRVGLNSEFGGSAGVGTLDYSPWTLTLTRPYNDFFRLRSNRVNNQDHFFYLYDRTTQLIAAPNQYCSNTQHGCEWRGVTVDPTHVYTAVAVPWGTRCYLVCDKPFVGESNGTLGTPPVYPALSAAETQGGPNPAQADSQSCACDPVNTATGLYFESATDVMLPGKGPNLAVERTYSAGLAAQDGPLGYGWTFNYGAKLAFGEPGTGGLPSTVTVVQENGSVVSFAADANGVYLAPPRVFATLTLVDGVWTFTQRGNQIMLFNGDGRLTTIRDTQGNAVHLGYVNGRLDTATAAGGRTLRFEWTGERLTRITDSAGRDVGYAYDDRGNLATVTGVDGAASRYGYDAKHRMTSGTAPGGAATTNVYDDQDRVVSQTDPLGQTTKLSYEGTPGEYTTTSTTITSPSGIVTVEKYFGGYLTARTRGAGTPLQQTWSYSVDNAGNITMIVEPYGNRIINTYDKNGNLTSQFGVVTTYWTYDAQGNELTATDGLGNTTESTYDGDGRLLTVKRPGGGIKRWAYGADGMPVSSTNEADLTTSYTYDSAGRLTSTTEPGGRTTKLTYDAAGNVTTTVGPDSAISRSTFDAAGRTLSSTDAAGRTTVYGYTPQGWRNYVKDNAGRETRIEYDALGRVTLTTDPALRTTKTTYTADGAIDTVTGPGTFKKRYEYDAIGQRIAEYDSLNRKTTFTYDAAGRPVGTRLPSGATSSVQYDKLGRVTLAIDAKGQYTGFGYRADGQLSGTTDPTGRTTTRTYTADGLLDTETAPDNSTIAYTYDKAGRILTYKDADGNITRYDYDAAGRLASRTLPGGLTTSYLYDSAGRPTRVTDPDGTVITSEYDPTGLPTTVTTGPATTTYSYDAVGRRATMQDSTGTSRYVYDLLGRLTKETNGAGVSVGYGYDATGNLETLTYPDGKSVTYQHDAAGETTSATDWTGKSTTFTYTDDGLEATAAYPNGVTDARAYDKNGQPSTITTMRGTTTLGTYTYAYDGAGQVTGDTTAGGAARTFTYNDTRQLASIATTSGVPSINGKYTTTPAGALTGLPNGTTLTYNSALQLTNATTVASPSIAYTYDGDGRRTSATTSASSTGYTYAESGALASVTNSAAGTVGYTSNAAGLRQSRTENSVTSQFVWSTQGGTPLLLDDGTYRYLYGTGITPYAQVDKAGTVQYLHTDALGSVRQMTDASGASIATNSYDPYGNRIHTGAADSRIAYTGAWTDPTTKLVHLRARDYDPTTGQFLTVDPMVDNTHQPYTYVGNDPLGVTDPNGLCADCNWLENAMLGAPAKWVADHLTSGPGAKVVSFLEGVGDTASMGLTGVIRDAISPGASCYVTRDAFYLAGEVFATVALSITPGGGAAGVARAGNVGRSVAATAQKVKAVTTTAVERVVTRVKTLFNQAKSCARHSFSPDTRVLMADGSTRAIRDVKLGDQVRATDPETGTTAAKTVTVLHTNQDTDLTDIAVRTGGEAVTLETTAHHPFWDRTSHRWVDAADLTIGHELLTTDGTTATVAAVHARRGPQKMLDLTVADIHTYYVVAGNTPVLVHNDGGDDYNQARNKALAWLEKRGFVAERTTYGKFGTIAGQPVGAQTADGKTGFRIEFDERNGAHINVWSGKEKGPHFNFDAPESTVTKIQGQFGCK